jgi:hypothetical protein
MGVAPLLPDGPPRVLDREPGHRRGAPHWGSSTVLLSTEQQLHYAEGDEMSHTVLVEFNCKQGLGAEVLKAMLEALPDSRAYEGAEVIEAYADENNADCIIVWEKWAGRVNQESYINWRTETGARRV